MTAVDVDALAKLLEAGDLLLPLSQSDEFPSWVEQDYGDGGSAVIAECYGEDRAALTVAAVNALPELLAEVRRGRALREAVEGLAEELAREADERADSNWLLAVGERSGLGIAITRLRAVLAAVDGGGQRWEQLAASLHRAEDAEERGEGICRTCLAPIWNEGGTVDRRKRNEGWSDRIERGGDSLVCFKAVDYRHVPLAGREAAIYDHAYARGAALRVSNGEGT